MNKNVIKRHLLTVLGLAFLLLISCKKEKVEDTKSTDTPTVIVGDTVPEKLNFHRINADDNHIQYIGRIDFSQVSQPTFSHPGTSIKAKFKGQGLHIILKDYGTGGDTKTNYYNIFIDGILDTVLQVNNSDTLYNISETLGANEHIVEIYKRTESSVGKTTFKGFEIKAGTTLLDLPPLPSRKFEFVGASMTCGYGNEVSIAAPPIGNPTTSFHSVHENNYESWGAMTARYFNAQYICVAHSGRGIYRNGEGTTAGVIPDFYNYISPYQTTNWDFSKYIPDVVVINLGNNDFAPEAWTTPSKVDSAAFCAAYINFLTTIRSKYPSAKIICTAGSMMNDSYPSGAKAWTRIQTYLQSIVNYKNTNGDGGVYYCKFNPQSAPYGEDWHPTKATHQKMATVLQNFISSILPW